MLLAVRHDELAHDAPGVGPDRVHGVGARRQPVVIADERAAEVDVRVGGPGAHEELSPKPDPPARRRRKERVEQAVAGGVVALLEGNLHGPVLRHGDPRVELIGAGEIAVHDDRLAPRDPGVCRAAEAHVGVAPPVVAPHDVHGPARAVHGDRGERVDAPVRVLEGATAVVVQVVADLDDVIHLHGTGKAAAAVHRLRHHRLAVEARPVAVLEHHVQFSVRAHRRDRALVEIEVGRANRVGAAPGGAAVVRVGQDDRRLDVAVVQAVELEARPGHVDPASVWASGPRVHRPKLLVVEVTDGRIVAARGGRDHGARRLDRLQVGGLAHEQHSGRGGVRGRGEAEAHVVGRAVRAKGGHGVAARHHAGWHGRAFAHVVPRRAAVARRVDAAGGEVMPVIVRAGEQAAGIVGIEGDGGFVLREAGLVLVRDHVGADALREARGVARALGRPWSRLVLQGGIDGHDTREAEDVVIAAEEFGAKPGRGGLGMVAAGRGDQRARHERGPAFHACLRRGFGDRPSGQV